jgi:hypothetical protein
MKSLCASVIVALLLAGSARSQQKPNDTPAASNLSPTTTQVLKFMEVMQVRQRLQSTLQTEQDQISTVVHNMFHKALPDATPAEKADFEEIIASELEGMFSDYPVEDVLRDMVPVYQSHFSESDLEQILAFYSSPIGQKVLKEMPAMTAEATRVTLTRLQPKIDKVMKNVSARIAAMVDANNKKEPSKPQ